MTPGDGPGRIQPTLRDGHAPVAASPTDLWSPGDEDREAVLGAEHSLTRSNRGAPR
jgi:hypothetical protein